jgi:predicted CopG family antitoxin
MTDEILKEKTKFTDWLKQLTGKKKQNLLRLLKKLGFTQVLQRIRSCDLQATMVS